MQGTFCGGPPPGPCGRGIFLNQTTNYQLSQWESSDRILMEDFNDDNAKIDAALKSSADAVTAIQSQLAGKGNCQVYFTTYTGNGAYDEGGARTLTFPHKPLFVVVTETDDSSCLTAAYGAPTVYTRATGAAWNEASWGEKSFTWWSDNAGAQLNESGKVYNVIAFLAADD